MGRKRKSEAAADSNSPKRVREPNFNADFLSLVSPSVPSCPARHARAIYSQSANTGLWSARRHRYQSTDMPSTIIAVLVFFHEIRLQLRIPEGGVEILG
jgi:hypothetical protein